MTKKPRRKYRRWSYTVGEFGPRPVDVHVGGRVKARRTLIGMSQEELGKHVGLTFQQIQKYEKGMDRITASRLWQFSLILGQPISWFFEGIGERNRKGDGLLAKRETLKFVRYLSACDPDVQKHLAAMINAVAGKAKPTCFPSSSWLMPINVRQAFTRPPTWTSTGRGPNSPTVYDRPRRFLRGFFVISPAWSNSPDHP